MTSVFEVFVVGGVPTTTYNPRANRRLAVDLRNIAAGRHTLGAVHGTTKCGKSVLIEKTLPSAIRIEGRTLTTVSALWYELASKLRINVDEQSTFTFTETAGSRTSGEVNVVLASGGAEGSESTETQRGRSWGNSQSLPDRVMQQLLDERAVVVIDDFHHALPDVRRDIARTLKSVLFPGVPVILASVSHRAYDAVVAEPEMEGRIAVIEVPMWDADELAAIGQEGFLALNVSVPPGVLARLADEALGSPQLMQLFCLELCLSYDVREVQDSYIELPEPEWSELFGDIARRSPAVIRLRPILLGPKERGHERNRMTTKDGHEIDIYGANLLAIRACGPVSSIPYRELREAMGGVLEEGNAYASQIKNALAHQSEIAASLVDGREFVDPAIHWDPDNDVLYVVDPFFSFYVRWGDFTVARR
jgi:hypothetical protein